MPAEVLKHGLRRDDDLHHADTGLFGQPGSFRTNAKLTNGETAAPEMVTQLEKIIGVVLREEANLGETKSVIGDYEHTLGTIVLTGENIAAEELRRLMCTQLPFLPAAFMFLTKEGWPVLKHQEHVIQASHLITEACTINIMKQFDKPRVGVKTVKGECVGFIFIDPNWVVRQVRDALDDQLREACNLSNFKYKFMDHNGWPVAPCQENLLTILDLFHRNHIHIQVDNVYCPSERFNCPGIAPEPVTAPKVLPLEGRKPLPEGHATDVVDGWPDRRKSVKDRLTNLKTKDVGIFAPKGDLVAKPILISYARAEASQFALDLKAELSQKGFSVYLDVDEIKTGSDWQDALNYAVTKCQCFVPLITQTYGKTLWTNREVKLADFLEKCIIPVNFLEYWPPECLAIQFATTQYIPSRPPDSGHVSGEPGDKDYDPRVWCAKHVRTASDRIAEICKMHLKQRPPSIKRPSTIIKRQELLSRGPSSSSRKLSYRRRLGGFSQDADVKIFGSMPPIRELSTEERNLVVISVHPKQQELAYKLTAELGKDGYEVWCSTELIDSQDQVFYDNLPTPRDLVSIPEGETLFGELYSTEEKKRDTTRIESETYDRKPLTRMSSQSSEISVMSSITPLTPDKVKQMKTFQQKADQAKAVIVIISANYTKSKTSQKQVYYCEHRKHVVMVKYDQSALPSWFKMLMGNTVATSANSPQFMSTLKAQVKRSLNATLSVTSIDKTAEAKIQFLVNYVKKSLPPLDTCVFISGSSSLQSLRAEQICRAVGKELSKVKNITIVTGGFFGAPDIVAKAFYDSKEATTVNDEEESSPQMSVIHLLPLKDSQDCSHKANQNLDGSFEPATYGKSIFVGESVKERETVVARLFDTCIVIEGGLGAAHEVEEFIWNDHFVIPIVSTGGAASGQYGVPAKIFEPPPCVSQSDWNVLQEKEASATKVAKAVFNMVIAIKESLAYTTQNKPDDSNRKAKNKARNSRSRSKRNKSVRDQDKKDFQTASQDDELHSVSFKSSAVQTKAEPRNRYGKWQRFLRIFSAAKIH